MSWNSWEYQGKLNACACLAFEKCDVSRWFHQNFVVNDQKGIMCHHPSSHVAGNPHGWSVAMFGGFLCQAMFFTNEFRVTMGGHHGTSAPNNEHFTETKIGKTRYVSLKKSHHWNAPLPVPNGTPCFLVFWPKPTKIHQGECKWSSNPSCCRVGPIEIYSDFANHLGNS